MKKFFLCSLLLSIAAVSLGFQLKVMTYNIRHARGIDNVVDLQRIVDVVKSEDPDILILNEVDQGNPRSAGVLQASEIALATGMEFFFGPTEDKNYYGNAVLSKFKILRSWDEILPQPRWLSAVKRGAAMAVVDVDGVEVLVVGTHLGLAGIKEVEVELGRIYEIFLQEGLPTIVAGDFNVEYFDLQNRMGHVISALRSANHYLEKSLSTIPSNNPGPQIDYILSSAEFTPRDAYTVQTQASDHLPVVALLELKR